MLNAFFASAPDHSCLVFLPATYRLDGTLLVSGKSGLEIHGQGATFAAQTQGDRDRQHVVISNSSNITVEDMKVRGANQQHLRSYWPLIFQHGFEIFRSTDVSLSRVEASEVYGDAVYIGGAGTANVSVSGGSFSYTGRQGISITEGKNVLLENFSLLGGGRYCIDLEPNVGRLLVEQVMIRNTISTCPGGWLIVHSSTVAGVYSSGNTFDGNPMPEGQLDPGIYPK